MKLILISDLHFTSKQSRHRTGNILADGKIKLKFIFKKAKKYYAHIVCSGDVFDSPRDIYALFEFIKIRSQFPEVKFYTVYGQHDLYMRNKSVMNNLAILGKANQITLLSQTPIVELGCYLYGAGWNEEIPEPGKGINLLAIHKPIYGNEIFPGQKFTQSETFLKEHKFDVVISGDIHRDFILEKQSRFILNTGPIIRHEATKFNRQHRPKLFIFDSRQRTIEEIKIPCRLDPFDQRFYSSLKNDQSLIDQEFINALSARSNLNIESIIESLIDQSPNKDKIKLKLGKINARD